MKRIIRLAESDLGNIIKKSVKKIYEARMEGFRLDVLTNSKTFGERIKYCINMLGSPIGIGSSRVVFQLDDDSVLKLARNEKGIGQNREEIILGSNPEFSCFPKILNGTDTNNFLWVISEHVLPAQKYDFFELMRIPFQHIQQFAFAVKGYVKRKDPAAKKLLDKFYRQYRGKPKVMSFFNDIYKLYAKYGNEIWDITRIPNWGLCNRNGEATLVILDIGFSIDVKQNLYRKK